MNNDDLQIHIIRDFLSTLNEVDLYPPLRDLFISKGYRTWITHGTHELGKDLIATNGIHNLLISVKKGDIDQVKWKSDVASSLEILMKTPIIQSGVDKNLPKIPILIFNGLMTTLVDQQIDYFNNFYHIKGEPKLEVWDINRLTTEFNKHLFSSYLVPPIYQEDINKVILSLTSDSIDVKLSKQFIDKYLEINNNFSHFKLAFLYLLRRAESKKNFYAFFQFAEYSIVKVWYQIFKNNAYSKIVNFDELHALYLMALEKWAKQITKTITNDGIFDELHGGLTEIAGYPLRTFDIIRRISYLSYVSYKTGQGNGLKYAKVLLKIINHNKASYSPLCEFNYNDIGLALTVLKLAKKDIDARLWLNNIMDFLIIHYKLGYELLPLGSDLDNIFYMIFEKRNNKKFKSYVIPLILDFAVKFNAKEIFENFRKSFNIQDVLFDLIMPEENYENEIYENTYLHSTDVKLTTYNSFDKWKLFYNKRINHVNRNYSPIVKNRPFVLILIANIYRDRLFNDVWKN